MPSPEFQTFLAALRQSGIGNATVTIEQERAGIEALGSTLRVTPGTTITPVDAGGVPAEWVAAPGAVPDRAVLYLHGGAYTTGSVRSHRGVASAISEKTGVHVLIIDYRLAPEAPFPAAVDDAARAYEWLTTRTEPRAVVVAGDSAGGGLALATLVSLRDRGRPLPAAAFAFSPWTDLAAEGDSFTARAERDPLVTAAQATRLAAVYLNGADPHSPLASPLYANLKGLPPLLVVVGTEEILYDDAQRLVARAQDAGVDAELQPWEGMIHTFPVFVGMFPEADEAIDAVAAFAMKHLSHREVGP